MTRLNRSRIKYTPGLCGTSCTFFCRSGFSFFNAATRSQITREERNGKLAASDRLAYTHCSHGPVGRLESHERHHIARPATGRWLQVQAEKKRPRGFRGRLQFLLGKQLCRYGLVVVVVVVSSCLITAAGWEANTTLRTTTRSPTVE